MTMRFSPDNFQEEPEELVYPEKLLSEAQSDTQDAALDLNYANLVVDVPNIGSLPNEEYALIRRKGLGGSDASVVLGVNPFKTRLELIKEKASDTLSEEEKAIGSLVAVRKGLDLEPLIIEKHKKYFGYEVYKPVDMYRHKLYPYLALNYDGVAGQPEHYFPVEIKVATAKGERHYNTMLEMFNEREGFKPTQPDISASNNSIATKAAHYGIPPYYYTQLQQEIMGTGAMFGYLSVLFDSDWSFHTFFVHRDEATINAIITEGYKVWQQVIALNPERGNVYV